MGFFIALSMEKYQTHDEQYVLNSKTQKEFIDLRRGKHYKLQIITQDLNVFKPPLGKIRTIESYP